MTTAKSTNPKATQRQALQDKTCLVTGATFGIGRETALGSARQGAQVVIVGRDASRAQGTAEWLRRETANDRVDFLLADLSSPAQVRQLAQAFRQTYEGLNVLVNNAGSMFTECGMSSDGFERTWALNHLAYVALTLDLLPLLTSSAPARIVNVASDVHKRGTIDFDDLQGEKRFIPFLGRNKSFSAIQKRCHSSRKPGVTQQRLDVFYALPKRLSSCADGRFNVLQWLPHVMRSPAFHWIPERFYRMPFGTLRR